METNDVQGRGEVILYQTEDGQTQLDVKLENETVWLTQDQMTVLFEKNQSTIARHISNAFKEGEVDKESNMRFLHNTSKYKPTAVYSLDVIISVGYRVHSRRGVHFRRWASSVLKDYLIHGYAVKNDLARQKYEELKQLVSVMGRTMNYVGMKEQEADQVRSIFDVVRDYTFKPGTGRSCIHLLKKRPPCCSIWSPRTIVSATATSASPTTHLSPLR